MLCETCIHGIARKNLREEQWVYSCDLDGKVMGRLVECSRYEAKPVKVEPIPRMEDSAQKPGSIVWTDSLDEPKEDPKPAPSFFKRRGRPPKGGK